MDIYGHIYGHSMKNIDQQITPDILNLIAEIDEFKGGWKSYKNLTPERLAALRHVATVESVASSTRIEGVKLSDREVESVMQNLKMQQFTTRDEQEVAGYAKAMELVFDSYDSIFLTENHLKQLHSVLLQHSTKDMRHRGGYKTLSNSVVAFDPDGKEIGIIFETTTPFETPMQMQALIAETNEAFEDRFLHPLIIIASFIVTFLAIHPFQDGNGRLSRVLTTLLLLQKGYNYVPYSSLESVVEMNKDSYYRALRRTQGTLKGDDPDWSHWLLFFLRSLKKQKNNLLQKVENEQYFIQNLPQLALDIMELAKNEGQLTTGKILQATGANRSTVKKRISELLNANILQRHGKGKGTWYSLK